MRSFEERVRSIADWERGWWIEEEGMRYDGRRGIVAYGSDSGRWDGVVCHLHGRLTLVFCFCMERVGRRGWAVWSGRRRREMSLPTEPGDFTTHARASVLGMTGPRRVGFGRGGAQPLGECSLHAHPGTSALADS